MRRRHFSLCATRLLALSPLAALAHAQAAGLDSISSGDASLGLKAALDQGASAAVSLLGKPDGFLANPKVRIPLPGYLKDAGKLLRTLGLGKQLDELETSMNRAAEQAVPLARQLLADAVRSITVADARKILSGGETSVTAFFAEKTRAPLFDRFLPTVTEVVNKVGVADRYNKIASKASGMGMKPDDPTIQHYVTRKALDGLYTMIGEEEKKIRRDPVGTGSALLQKVFGAMK